MLSFECLVSPDFTWQPFVSPQKRDIGRIGRHAYRAICVLGQTLQKKTYQVVLPYCRIEHEVLEVRGSVNCVTVYRNRKNDMIVTIFHRMRRVIEGDSNKL